MSDHSFGTAINCMDGRTQDPVSIWIKEKFGVEYVDAITEPGPDKILADRTSPLVDSIKARVDISVNGHGSKNIVIVSHDKCAGNPVSKAEHLAHLKKAMDTLKSWDLPVSLFGVWVEEKDGKWVVELLHEM